MFQSVAILFGFLRHALELDAFWLGDGSCHAICSVAFCENLQLTSVKHLPLAGIALPETGETLWPDASRKKNVMYMAVSLLSFWRHVFEFVRWGQQKL